jgi:hypothetical protein
MPNVSRVPHVVFDRLWSRNRQNLDDFVSAARDFYVESQALPRKQLDFKHELVYTSLRLLYANVNISPSLVPYSLHFSNNPTSRMIGC